MSSEITEDDVRRLFREDIAGEVSRARTDFAPEISCVFKNITYDTFQDPDFVALMKKHFGSGAIQAIFEEHDAAPEERLAPAI